ncbi:MAG: BamA/TamA family outer membrane protein [Calditrichia bacterium]
MIKPMLIKYIRLLIVLMVFPPFFMQTAAAQEPQSEDVPALQEIKLITSPTRVSLPLRNVAKKYRFRPLTRQVIKQVQEEVLTQFRKHGYYLAQVDSHKVELVAPPDRGKLTFYVTTGFQLRLSEVKLNLTDSLQAEFSEALEEVTLDFKNKIFNSENQTHLFSRIIEIFENQGYPLCKIITREFALDSLERNIQSIRLILDIDPGPKVRLSGIKLPGESDANRNYLRRLLRFRRGELYQEKRIQRYHQILSREDFIKTANMPRLVLGKDSLFFLLLDFEEATSTALDGIVGYVPPPSADVSQKGYFTGLVNLGLRNIFGTGRKLDIFWQKPDRFSEEFRMKYREPFVLGLPFHTGVEMHRMVRDTTYIECEYALAFEIPLNENLQGLFRLYNRQVFPDSLASLMLRLPHTKAVHSELGVRWDNRDNKFNPRKGTFLSVLFDYGTQRNVGPQYLIEQDSLIRKSGVSRLTASLGLYFTLWRNQIYAFNLHTVVIGYKGQKVLLPDMFWFGGATTIRGYREQQFFAERVTWANHEYRFLLGPRSSFFLFTDVGYYFRETPRRQDEFLLGYGLGIRFPVPLGIMQVDYGLARGLPFREGKIHFRIVNEF